MHNISSPLNVRTLTCNFAKAFPAFTAKNVKCRYLPILAFTSIIALISYEFLRQRYWRCQVKIVQSIIQRQDALIQSFKTVILEQDFSPLTLRNLDQDQDLSKECAKARTYFPVIFRTSAFKSLAYEQEQCNSKAEAITSLRTLFVMLQVLNENGKETTTSMRQVLSFLLLVPTNLLLRVFMEGLDRPDQKKNPLSLYFSTKDGVLQKRYQEMLENVKKEKGKVEDPEKEALDRYMQGFLNLVADEASQQSVSTINMRLDIIIFKCILGFKSETVPRDVLNYIRKILKQDAISFFLSSTSKRHEEIANYLNGIDLDKEFLDPSNILLENLSEILNQILVLRLIFPDKFEKWVEDNPDKSACLKPFFEKFRSQLDALSEKYLDEESDHISMSDMNLSNILREIFAAYKANKTLTSDEDE